MKKVTCISYHNSGSGAVDDYLREYSGIEFAPSDVECRFLQDPDGISDLEYNLVDNWHRLNSGFALKRYERFARLKKRTYSLIFGDSWEVETEKYIKSLVSFEFPGYWHADIDEQPFYSWFIFKCRRALTKVMPANFRKSQDYNYFPKLHSYHTRVSREEFYKVTQNYCEALCNSISHVETEYVVLDQCVSTTNIQRYLNYINDLKIIIVDRDPRDLYIDCIRSGDHVLPHNPHFFAIQYRDMRRNEELELQNSNVLKIQFEDLIYHYDTTTSRIIDFLGLHKETHLHPKKYFDPNISIKNTQIWKSDSRFAEQLKVIEEELFDYFYNEPIN